MSAPTFTPAQKAATTLESQVLNLQQNVAVQARRLTGLIANGVPAQGDVPAVSAADLASALGSNLDTVNGILAALAAAVPAT